MEDEELVLLNNLCADLVSLKKWEAFPRHLLSQSQSGEWVGVQQRCIQLGLDAEGLKPDLFAAWLADPMNEKNYVVVIFYDDESKWTMAAHYNRQRLLQHALAANEGPRGQMMTSEQLTGAGPSARTSAPSEAIRQ